MCIYSCTPTVYIGLNMHFCRRILFYKDSFDFNLATSLVTLSLAADAAIWHSSAQYVLV